MDHLLVTAEEVGESTQFYSSVLGFRGTEQLLDGNGHQIGTWMERSHSPHDLAVVSGPSGGLHHFAYWLDDWDHVRTAADILAYNGISVDVGPTRHGITRGSTIYFFDPLVGLIGTAREPDRVFLKCSQGTIVDRSQEHLRRSDAGVALLRKMFKENMQIVEDGGDPLGTVRTPHEVIELPCEKDKFGAGTAFTDQWINGGSMRYAPIREELLALHRAAAIAREKASTGG